MVPILRENKTLRLWQASQIWTLGIKSEGNLEIYGMLNSSLNREDVPSNQILATRTG